MKRIMHTLLVVTAMAVLTAGPSVAQGELSVAITSGQIYNAAKAAFFDPFERETGIKVISQPLDPPDAVVRLKAMHDSGTVTIGVLALETRHLIVAGRSGLLEPIDYTVVDRKALLPEAASTYGVGFEVWGNVIGYNKKKYPSDSHPKNWAEFWDLKKFPGPRVMRDDPYPTLIYALLADGVSPDALFPLDLDRAFRKLDEIKGSLVWYKAGGQPPQMLIDGIADLAACGIGRCMARIVEGAPIAMVWDGGTVEVDHFAVAKGTKNRVAAMKFLAFVTRPDRQAEFVKLSLFAPTNPATFDLLSADLIETLPSSPKHYPKLVKSDWGWWDANYDKIIETWNSWKLK
jgi:putative spermidine/putrescine transport system substrate-binding protein